MYFRRSSLNRKHDVNEVKSSLFAHPSGKVHQEGVEVVEGSRGWDYGDHS